MINEVILVGKLLKVPEVIETSSGAKVANIILEIKKNFKNGYGVYESDYVSCVLWRGIAESLMDCCQQGSMLGIKGRLQSRTYETSDKQRISTMEVVAEKVIYMDKYFISKES